MLAIGRIIIILNLLKRWELLQSSAVLLWLLVFVNWGLGTEASEGRLKVILGGWLWLLARSSGERIGGWEWTSARVGRLSWEGSRHAVRHRALIGVSRVVNLTVHNSTLGLSRITAGRAGWRGIESLLWSVETSGAITKAASWRRHLAGRAQ